TPALPSGHGASLLQVRKLRPEITNGEADDRIASGAAVSQHVVAEAVQSQLDHPLQDRVDWRARDELCAQPLDDDERWFSIAGTRAGRAQRAHALEEPQVTALPFHVRPNRLKLFLELLQGLGRFQGAGGHPADDDGFHGGEVQRARPGELEELTRVEAETGARGRCLGCGRRCQTSHDRDEDKPCDQRVHDLRIVSSTSGRLSTNDEACLRPHRGGGRPNASTTRSKPDLHRIIAKVRAAMIAGSLALVMAIVPPRAGGDDWPGPVTLTRFSDGGEFFVRISPGTSVGDTFGFASGTKGRYARARFYALQPDQSYRLIREAALLNPVAPVDAVVSRRGDLITFDN